MKMSTPARPERVLRWLCAALLVLVAFTPVARASREFPVRIAGALALPLEPACTLCHTRADAGFATGTLFQQALASRGFRRRDVASLDAALMRLEADAVDSDGDGVGDVRELRALADPNDPRDRGRAPTGCAVAGGAPRSVLGAEALAACLLVLGLLGAHRARAPC
jgi:hypothetical protein